MRGVVSLCADSLIMSDHDPNNEIRPGDGAMALSIMFFAVGLLCFLLGWADGVRHGTRYLGIPETGGWLVAAAILAVLGVLFLLRVPRRG